MKDKKKVRSKLWDDIRRLADGHAAIFQGHTHMCIHIINADSRQHCGKLLKPRNSRKEFRWITTIGVAHMMTHPDSNIGQGSLH